MTATQTDTEREVRSLPRLDEAGIRAAAAAWVEARLADATTAEERAVAARKIIDAEEKASEKARVARDNAACTLVAHYRVRRGANIAGALGVNRTRWQMIRDKIAAAHGFTRVLESRDGSSRTVGSWDDLMAAEDFTFPEVPDAPKVLPKHAADAEKHAQRAAHARVIRDQAITELTSGGMRSAKVAELAGIDPSRVSHIKHRPAGEKVA